MACHAAFRFSWMCPSQQVDRASSSRRHAAICLAVSVLIVGKLLTYRERHGR